jgi:hypothetical protein
MASNAVYHHDIINQCRSELAQLLQPRPEFSDLIDDLDPHVCSRADLVAAIEAAPVAELRMYLYAVYEFREMLMLSIGAKF